MFPGGPNRRDDAKQERERTKTRLRSGEDLEAGIRVRQSELKASGQRRSMVIALTVAVVVAGVTGLYVGLQSRVTPEELAERERLEKEASELDDLAREVMGELWRMEEIEAARNRR